MNKWFDSVSICEMSRDSNESVFTYGHWLAAMVADRQRKVKLLAIEEEMARLELEMLMETRAGYLGPTLTFPDLFGKNVRDDIIRFDTFYLDPTARIAGIQFSREMNIDIILGKFLDKGNVIPSAIWIGIVKAIPIYVFFLADGENGSYYVVSQSAMGGVTFRKEDFTPVWSSRAKDNPASLTLKQDDLNKKIKQVASAAVAAGGSRKKSKDPDHDADMSPKKSKDRAKTIPDDSHKESVPDSAPSQAVAGSDSRSGDSKGSSNAMLARVARAISTTVKR